MNRLEQWILAIDQGTTNTKAILVDPQGRIISRGSSQLNIYYPKPGWVEQNPDEIWESVLEAIGQCLKGYDAKNIIALGISNQRESIIAWDQHTGKAVAPSITWQCRRSTDICQKINDPKDRSIVFKKTGLPVDPLFPASKIKWLKQHVIRTRRNVLFGTIDSWLCWKLTNGRAHLCDMSNASRTQLFNLKKKTWDEDLGQLFGVDLSSLPKVCESSYEYGYTERVRYLPDGVLIASMLADSHAALFGNQAFYSGDIKVTLGTGSSIMSVLNTYPGSELLDGLVLTVAWAMEGKVTYAYEGNVLVCASSLPWITDILGVSGGVDQVDRYAQKVKDTGGVYFVPSLVGLGSPYWTPEARGMFYGLSFNTTKFEIARSTMESIAYQVYDVFLEIKKQSGNRINRLNIDGGPSSNVWLMKFMADILDHDIWINEVKEISALGAAYMAGLSCKVWNSVKDLTVLHHDKIKYSPDRKNPLRRIKLIDGWRDAVRRVLL